MRAGRVIASVVLVRVASAADVVIVGAGQAGMAAAHLLASEGHTVHVLEATDHVGGRTRNIDAHTYKFDVVNDDALELGGTWFSPNHTAALKLCHELGVEVYNASFFDRFSHEHHGTKAPVEEWPWWFWGSDYPLEQQGHLNSTVFHTSKGVFRFRETQGLLTALPQDVLDELNQAGRFLTRAVSQLSNRCWAAPFVDNTWRRWDVDTTFGILRSKVFNKESKQVLRNSIHNKNAEEPEEVSFLYNLLSFKGCFSAGPDSQFRVRGGTQAIPHAIATRLSKNVTLNAPVQSIRSGDGNVQVTTRDGVKYSAAAVIVTGPPPTVLNIDFEPPLAGTTAQLLQRMPMGTSMKFSIIYQQGPWWRAMGFQGDIISTSLPMEESLPDSGIPLFVQCIDHSPYSLKAGVVVCFIEGRQNLYFTSLPAEKQRSLMLHFLTRSFNDTRASTLNPKFVAHNWADQPFARGAYTGFMPPGVLSVPEFWKSYRNMEKLPNVFLAGSDYHTGFGVGYIEGAIRSGQLAARRVQSRLNAHRGRIDINKQSASPALYV